MASTRDVNGETEFFMARGRPVAEIMSDLAAENARCRSDILRALCVIDGPLALGTSNGRQTRAARRSSASSVDVVPST